MCDLPMHIKKKKLYLLEYLQEYMALWKPKSYGPIM